MFIAAILRCWFGPEVCDNDDRMKITCAFGPFLPVPPLRGGAVERIFWTLCKEWARLGHDVTIIARQFPGQPNDEVVNSVRYLRVPSWDAPQSRLLYRVLDVLYARRVARALLESDVTITHSVSMPMLLDKERAGKIYVSVGRFPKRQMWLYRRVDRLQAVSNAVADAIREQTPALSPLVRVVPNCLSDAFADARSETQGARQKEVLFVGRLAREKGLHLLIRAFTTISPRFPDWRLSIIGPYRHDEGGDGQEYIEELRREAGSFSDRITFDGPIFGESDLIARYRRAEVFVYPSLAENGESFGLAPLEAMSCGCTTVVSRLKCFEDFVSDGRNALVFDHRDESGGSLGASLSSLLSSDEMRERLALAGRATSRAFAPSEVAQAFLDDFESLLRRQQPKCMKRM